MQLRLALAFAASCGLSFTSCSPSTSHGAGTPEGSMDVMAAVQELSDHMPGSADEALGFLLEGNTRFVTGEPEHSHQTIARRMKLTDGQHPCAVVLTCADSRVVPELIFDIGLGDLFVIRVAGNVVAEDEAGSIEYAVEHLDVPLVIVLGHESCGAVTAALGGGEDDFDELTRLLGRLGPPLEDVDRQLPMAQQIKRGVEANVRYSVAQLRDLLSHGGHVPEDLEIVPAVYELETGRVRVLED
ncbi:MAG: carbonic anhydrase [Planctomycetota bacterium]|jgi:carbonic anhydrase